MVVTKLLIIKVILNGYVIETNIPVVVVVVPKETPAVLQVGKVLLPCYMVERIITLVV